MREDHPAAPGGPVGGAGPQPAAPSSRLLPAGHGLSWRPLTRQDNADLVELLSRIETCDDPPYRTTAEESAETFVAVPSDIGSAKVIGLDDDGVPRAYAILRLRHTPDGGRALCDGGVDPQWRRQGIGTTLLRWQLSVARELLDDADIPEALAVVHVEESMGDAQEMLEMTGFTATRWYTEMRRDLSVELPDVELQGHLAVQPWEPALDDAVRRAHNEAFRDQWGAEQHTPETWVQGRTYFAPSWSFVVLDRTSDRARVAGYLISGRYEGDWAAQGWTEGYTEMLGVREEWRGKGVASALLVAAMRAYAADGMEYAGLGVDFSEPSGNFGLFGHLGYEPTRGSLMYTRTI